MTSLPDPKFVYKATPPPPPATRFPPLNGPHAINLGTYSREKVSNVDVDPEGRAYFDLGLRHMLSYQHEMATHCFLASLHYSPDCALSHGLIALCHAPNYNFKGEAYYNSTDHQIPEEEGLFPSQQLANKHSKLAMDKVEELRRRHKKPKKKSSGKKKNANAKSVSHQDDSIPKMISDIESQILVAIRALTCCPGIDFALSEEAVARPYADFMRKVHQKFPEDAEVAYLFSEALMVMNAWRLYEYPTGKPLSPDVEETRQVLETALKQHFNHAGLCHMYVHLSEMSSDPGKALTACRALRTRFPHAGHLLHMPTHIDVLVGDYENCVRYNYKAIRADEHCIQASPETASTTSFYFGYSVHNYHMLVYGATLGGMEEIGKELALELKGKLSEEMFAENVDLVSYLESYSALDIHVMVRFGRWEEILQVEVPRDKHLMLFRTATLTFARGLALAQSGRIEQAKKEADRYDSIRKQPEAEERILHNNQVSDLLAVDSPMLRGEIAYREGKYDLAFKLLRKAVQMQDSLHFDEPWGKMQPVRHALGGLLLEQGHAEEAEEVFATDLEFHPNNPWALKGLISCLGRKVAGCCASTRRNSSSDIAAELEHLQDILVKQRQSKWADYNVTVACACCQEPQSALTNGK